MDKLTPFFDAVVALYLAVINYKASSVLVGIGGFFNVLTLIPSMVSAAPAALAAFENLSDADRTALDSYVSMKIPNVSPAITAKIYAGVDAVLRQGGVIQDVIVLFKTEPVATAAVDEAKA